MPGATALTIGNFDGVHLGHAALVRRARACAGPDGRVVVMSFWPHPITVLRPERAPDTLTPFERRTELLQALGADEVVRIEPSKELLGLAPEEFIRRVVAEHAPTCIVEGADFRFGRARAGDVELLARLGADLGFRAEVVQPVRVATADQLVAEASSTLVRWLISEGRVRDAARVLGRPHEVRGVVVEGAKRGRDIGFPTANLASDAMLPADGVYAGVARLPGGERLPAAVSVGSNPTFGDESRRLEAHLIDWNGPVDDYGWPLTVELVAWLRDQITYRGVEPLIEQIRRDIADTNAALRRDGAAWRLDAPTGACAETGAA
jgi:riboflavin kinase/FMN adenylyltransferase